MGKRTVKTKDQQAVALVMADINAKNPPAKPGFDLAAIERQAVELMDGLTSLGAAMVDARLAYAMHHVKVGQFLHHAEEAWLAAGKPCKKPDLWKACQTNSTNASRFRNLSVWYEAEAATLEALPDVERAQAIEDKLAELRSMSKAATSERKAKAEAEADEPEDDTDVQASIEAMIEETVLAVMKRLGLEDDDKAMKVLTDEITECVVSCRKL